MSSLDFIPRTLKRRKVEAEKPSAHEVQNSARPGTEETTQTARPESKDQVLPKPQKTKQQQSIKPPWDLAFLVWLALSDYWLWADGDLRRRMETGGNSVGNPVQVDEDSMAVDEKESQESDEQGYVPLDHLFKQSHIFRLVSNLQPYCDAKEIAYVNSLRQFAKDTVDVRFIVDTESSSTRAAVSGRRRRPQSGYEVRRTDFSSLKDSEFSRYSKNHWDGLTVYMENIPIQYAKVPGIGKLITALLPASSTSPIKRVQNIVFPSHHQDLPGSIPICKGFALVALSSEDDVQTLLDAWPWDSEKRANPPDSTKLKEDDMTLDKKVDNPCPEARSAKASGLRICTKARWEELKAEYLLRRQELVDEINQYQDEAEARWQKEDVDEARYAGSREGDQVASSSKRKQPESTVQYEAGIHPDSPFPAACLGFVRHVHPETNKTTLRTLFSQAWAESDNAIEYIDYSKNTDSCYIRFGTPAHAELFVDYFSSHNIVQLSGLDSNGSESSSSEVKPIAPEIVLGKREEVYWDKIPEKLRRQAVEKTLKTIHGPHFVGGSVAAVEEAQGGDGGGRRKRKGKAKAPE